MNNIFTYKGYTTRVEYSPEDGVLHGKVEGVSDLVNFESSSLDRTDVENAFHEAVDDYIAFCEEVGKSPQKEYRGTFNVRISSGLHRKLDQSAYQAGISMNQMLERAVKYYFDCEEWQKAGDRLGSMDQRVLGQANSAWSSFGRPTRPHMTMVPGGLINSHDIRRN